MGKLEQPSLSALAASFFDASEDCVKVVGLDGALLAMNANGICLMEIDDFELMRGKPWVEFWPESQRPLIDNAMEQARAGAGSRFSADCPTAAGTLKAWEVVVWPVLDDTGAPTQIISISRDVTVRKRDEEQRALFTRELAHRIKNTFAVVDGVIALSARSAAEAKGFADTLRRRLTGLGRAISYMAPPDFTDLAPPSRSVKGLVGVLLEPYGALEGPDAQIFVTGDDTSVGAEATTTLALIFNELATNAMKYGGLRAADGRVDVVFKTTADSLSVAWTETIPPGAAPLAQPKAPGFGSALLERAVVRQLGGHFSRDWTPAGLAIAMDIPLTRVAA